jgi:hypothetical protein
MVKMSAPNGKIVLSLKERSKMTLDEYKAHIEAQRNASKAQALSVLSATIKEIKKGDN